MSFTGSFTPTEALTALNEAGGGNIPQNRYRLLSFISHQTQLKLFWVNCIIYARPMKLQYISDSTGQTTGVFIPIDDWNALKNKFKGIEEEEITIPGWHKDLVNDRLEEYKANPGKATDLESALNDIDNDI